MIVAVDFDVKTQIRFLLRTGAQNTITIAQILKALRLPRTPTNDRRVRLTMESLTQDDKLPIVSNIKPPYGYYLAETEDDCLKYLTRLQKQLEGTAWRKHIAMLAFEHHKLLHPQQLELFRK